jgi:DNA (cytosine-5)-methyltransferase 1
MTPRLLDLFCGAGGCSVGYARAGFEVVGVDLEPMPNYPFEFIQTDAIALLEAALRTGMVCGVWRLADFDAIHASPPCQAFSLATLYHGRTEKHPDLIEPTRALLKRTGLPYVIENVAGAPIRKDVLLCGEMFGLRLHRHRYFETEGFLVMQPPHSRHGLKGAIHNCHIEDGHARLVAGNYADHESASEAMGIDWMTRAELAEAIPPAYCEHIGGYLRSKLTPTEEQVA